MAETIDVTSMSPREQHEHDISTIRNFLAYFADELGGTDQVADTIERLNEDLIVKMDPIEAPKARTCTECVDNQRSRDEERIDLPAPTNWWHCQNCDSHISRYRGQSDVQCPVCGAEYNASGQRLRDDWRGNASNYDEDVSDLDGYEAQHADDDRY